MDQVQTVQKPVPSATNQPMGTIAPDQMAEKKSGGWFKWVIIILAILIIGGLAWYIFTP